MSSFPFNVICETSTVHDGNMSFKAGSKSDVTSNRVSFLAKFKIAPYEHIAMLCNHGSRITYVDHDHFSVGAFELEDQVQSDVLVTQEKHLALFLLTADCIPLSLYDKTTHTIALAHISRKTFVDGLIQKTITFLSGELGVVPQNLQVHIGPHIKKDSYVFQLPLQEEPDVLKNYIKIKDAMAHIDLPLACTSQLEIHGVLKENIFISPIDTGISKDYFSYYRMKKNNEPDSARMATILMQR